jgi:hypothetical protein
MSPQARRELLEAVRPRYRKANRPEKKRILDEFVAATGYHRKYAIQLLNHGASKTRNKVRKRRRTYTAEVVAALIKIWDILDGPCGKRLHPYLPEFVAVLERTQELVLDPQTKGLLLQMSRATIDRLLKEPRQRPPRRTRGTTKPGSLLKNSIPVRVYTPWDEQRPGFVEVDLVAHGGDSAAGEFLYTLNTVDVATGWTETVAIANRGQAATFQGLLQVRQQLPMPLLGIDSDNGAEFINAHLLRYCQQEHITFTRCRPYKKNDQAHIEQKNWSVVRRVVGYERYESAQALDQLQDLYHHLRLYLNFFQPVMKLVGKERFGSRVKKRYDQARTAYQRILEAKEVSQTVKDELQALYLTLNPVSLRRQIDNSLNNLWDLAVR